MAELKTREDKHYPIVRKNQLEIVISKLSNEQQNQVSMIGRGMYKPIISENINAPNIQIRKMSKIRKLEHSCFIIDGYSVFVPRKCSTCKYGQSSIESDFSNFMVRRCSLRDEGVNRKRKKYGCEYYSISLENINEIIDKYNK